MYLYIQCKNQGRDEDLEGILADIDSNDVNDNIDDNDDYEDAEDDANQLSWKYEQWQPCLEHPKNFPLRKGALKGGSYNLENCEFS